MVSEVCIVSENLLWLMWLLSLSRTRKTKAKLNTLNSTYHLNSALISLAFLLHCDLGQEEKNTIKIQNWNKLKSFFLLSQVLNSESFTKMFSPYSVNWRRLCHSLIPQKPNRKPLIWQQSHWQSHWQQSLNCIYYTYYTKGFRRKFVFNSKNYPVGVNCTKKINNIPNLLILKEMRLCKGCLS